MCVRVCVFVYLVFSSDELFDNNTVGKNEDLGDG